MGRGWRAARPFGVRRGRGGPATRAGPRCSTPATAADAAAAAVAAVRSSGRSSGGECTEGGMQHALGHPPGRARWMRCCTGIEGAAAYLRVRAGWVGNQHAGGAQSSVGGVVVAQALRRARPPRPVLHTARPRPRRAPHSNAHLTVVPFRPVRFSTGSFLRRLALGGVASAPSPGAPPLPLGGGAGAPRPRAAAFLLLGSGSSSSHCQSQVPSSRSTATSTRRRGGIAAAAVAGGTARTAQARFVLPVPMLPIFVVQRGTVADGSSGPLGRLCRALEPAVGWVSH